jgi:hypothetical protein
MWIRERGCAPFSFAVGPHPLSQRRCCRHPFFTKPHLRLVAVFNLPIHSVTSTVSLSECSADLQPKGGDRPDPYIQGTPA